MLLDRKRFVYHLRVLDVRNLSLMRERRLVLEDVSLRLQGGEILGLTGPNGGGKTSLFETLLGWLRPSEGQITTSRPLRFGYLAQDVGRARHLPLSVRDFVEMGSWGRTKANSSDFEIESLLKSLGLETHGNRLIAEISGGEFKRVCLARSLLQSADVYLLDEPFNHLDLESEERVGHLLRDLVDTKKKSFIIISHDWHAMNHFFDRVILLNRRVLASGSVAEVSKVFLNWLDPKHHEWMHPR